MKQIGPVQPQMKRQQALLPGKTNRAEEGRGQGRAEDETFRGNFAGDRRPARMPDGEAHIGRGGREAPKQFIHRAADARHGRTKRLRLNDDVRRPAPAFCATAQTGTHFKGGWSMDS